MRGRRHAPAALPPGKESVPIVQEVGWAPGQVWTATENLELRASRPAHSESLYQLHYRGNVDDLCCGKMTENKG